MTYPSKREKWVEQLRTIDPLWAALEKVKAYKKKKADPLRKPLSKRRMYWIKHPDLYRKWWE